LRQRKFEVRAGSVKRRLVAMRPALPLVLLLSLAWASVASADVENNLVLRRQNGETIAFPATA